MTNSQTYPFSWFYGCQCRKDSSSWELRRLSVPPLNAICTRSLTCTRNNMDAGPMEIDEGGGTSWHVPPVPIPQFLIRWTETETEIEKKHYHCAPINHLPTGTLFFGSSVVPTDNLVVYLTKHSLISIAVSS